MADPLDEDDFPDVEYPTLVDYAERVMDGQIEDLEWMTLHEMADSNPDLFPSGGISTSDAHTVAAIMSLTTVIYSWPTPEEVAHKIAVRETQRRNRGQ